MGINDDVFIRIIRVIQQLRLDFHRFESRVYSNHDLLEKKIKVNESESFSR